jgi:hypothetical protein
MSDRWSTNGDVCDPASATASTCGIASKRAAICLASSTGPDDTSISMVIKLFFEKYRLSPPLKICVTLDFVIEQNDVIVSPAVSSGANTALSRSAKGFPAYPSSRGKVR